MMRLILGIFCFSGYMQLQAQNSQMTLSFGGTGYDYASDVAIDNSENIYLIGTFEGSMDIDPGVSSAILTSTGASDVFIVKLSSDGTLLWGKSFGGVNSETGEALAIDENGNVYVSGNFNGLADFDPSQEVVQLSGSNNVFISKFNSNGDFLWSKGVGGDSYDYVYSITTDADNNILVTGHFEGGGDYDPGSEASYLYTSSGYAAFILKLSSDGDFIWAKAVGQSSLAEGYSIKADAQGNVYCLGRFSYYADFDPSANEHFVNAIGGFDAFLLKLTPQGEFTSIFTFGGPGNDNGKRVLFNQDGDIVITGTFEGIGDFDPTAAAYNLTTNGLQDIYVAKLTPDGELTWAFNIGGSDSDFVHGLAVDFIGNIVLSGNFKAIADFDPGEGESNLVSLGETDGFLLGLTGDGTFLHCKRLGGPSVDDALAVAVTSTGESVVTGLFNVRMNLSEVDPTLVLYSKGNYDVFLLKRSVITGVELGDLFKIFPNPAEKEINVNKESIHFSKGYVVVDMLGRTVLSGNLSPQNSSIDITQLSPGVYSMSFDKTRQHSLRFIKK